MKNISKSINIHIGIDWPDWQWLKDKKSLIHNLECHVEAKMSYDVWSLFHDMSYEIRNCIFDRLKLPIKRNIANGKYK